LGDLVLVGKNIDTTLTPADDSTVSLRNNQYSVLVVNESSKSIEIDQVIPVISIEILKKYLENSKVDIEPFKFIG
jgi:hypothetical protein